MIISELMRKKKAKRKLRDIQVDEISLVDRAANQHSFAITKREAEELEDLLKIFFGNDEEGFSETLLKAKEMSEEAASALKKALTVLNKYITDFPDSVQEAIKALARFSPGYGYPGKDEYEEGKKKPGYPTQKSGISELDLWAISMMPQKLREKIIQKRAQVEEEDYPIDELEGEPHSRGISKQSKYQEDNFYPEEEEKTLWPSL